MILLEVLRAAPGRTQTIAELRKWLRAARPAASVGLLDQTVVHLVKRGHVVRGEGRTVTLTDAGAAHAQLDAAHHGGTKVAQLSPTCAQVEREGSPPPAAHRRRVSRPRPAAPDAAPSPPATAGVSPSEPGPVETPAPGIEDAPDPAGVVLTRLAGRGPAAPAGTQCEVCGRRLRHGEPHVVIVAPDLEVPVCAECAADGDDAMRIAAAPILRDLVRRLRRRRAS